ncbi:hypothetical protein DCAR_0726948 [Daucus carota subsp. sativus]|uniref:F-box domain-containing protein n=1 Tax=Daucus carota subsp. sativus TaxID=79200 RepID=A0A164SMU8_DAUCS|nr:hypothetical protein DCAR_0726945 [Daucus carota subsp. sativus]WOH07518.1 hypothetical protein DCAR_0726948 [Daucus carota subsp. sativus]
MDSLLPKDIFLEILFLLPVKSLLRCKFVCKSWRSRISDPDFVKQHIARTTNNPNNDLFIAYDEFNLFLSVIDVTIDRSTRLNRRIDNFSHIVGSCNGLLCLADKAKELYLWNPVTRQVKNMHGYKYIVGENSADYGVAFGFGFDHASSDYKAVRIVQKINVINVINRVELYSLKENCWKEINAKLDFGLIDKSRGKVTSVNGSIYWLARKRMDDSGLVVLSFDVQSLKFGTIQFPDDLSVLPFYWRRNYDEFSVLQFKEYVALCYSLDLGGCVVIYTLLDGNCWCKNMTVRRLDYLVGCLKTGELIGLKYRYDGRRNGYHEDVVLYDSVNDVAKSIQPIPSGRRTLYHYTESLLDLN